ncbi:MAG: hypothetical protein QM770_07090 [Tepidisphaeraceae bacterium]
MLIVADHTYRDEGGHALGVFLFARNGLLAGLEVWSIDGLTDRPQLPSIEQVEAGASMPAADDPGKRE